MFKRLKGTIGKIDEQKSSNTLPQVSLLYVMNFKCIFKFGCFII